MDLANIFTESFWYMAPIIVVAVTAITGFINGLIKTEKGWVKQLISWAVGIVLSVLAYFGGLLEIGDPVWLGLVMMSIIVGLSSNGFYDIPAIKKFIDSWFPDKSVDESH